MLFIIRRIIMVCAVLLIVGCRSHKEMIIEEQEFSCSDSVSSRMEVLQVSNQLENSNVSILSEQRGERVEFLEDGGEIEFYPDGRVTLTGVAALQAVDVATIANRTQEVSISDSTLTHSVAEASQASASISTVKEKKNRESGAKSYNALFLIALLVAGFLIVVLLRGKNRCYGNN